MMCCSGSCNLSTGCMLIGRLQPNFCQSQSKMVFAFGTMLFLKQCFLSLKHLVPDSLRVSESEMIVFTDTSIQRYQELLKISHQWNPKGDAVHIGAM